MQMANSTRTVDLGLMGSTRPISNSKVCLPDLHQHFPSCQTERSGLDYQVLRVLYTQQMHANQLNFKQQREKGRDRRTTL